MNLDYFFKNELFNKTTDLCKIMNDAGSDKGSGHHNYTTFYNYIFSDIKDQVSNVFELGLGTNNLSFPSNMGKNGIPGASLRGWKRFFKSANIFGADIDKDILISENRITTYYCDQTDFVAIDDMWKKMPVTFDIIIEDGLHEFSANVHFFMNSHHKLKKGGFYVIEDILVDEIERFQSFINTHSSQFEIMELLKIPNPINPVDNTLLFIKK